MKEATFERADMIANIIANLRAVMPPTFARKDIPSFLGSSLPLGTLANMGKQGPPYIRHKRHAIYEIGSFLAWYESWLNDDSNRTS